MICMLQMWCIGNGQNHQNYLQSKVGALNCMHDQQMILRIGGGTEQNEPTTRNPALCLLWETYGKEKTLEWGVAVLESLQQAEILRPGMYESSVQGEAEDRQELDGNPQTRPRIVAKWLLRDMRKQQEHRCSPYRWESAEQRFVESPTALQELSYENPSSAQDLFDMWSKGKGIWILQQTLYQIQEIWRPINGRKGGDGMKEVSTVVRRLTPL